MSHTTTTSALVSFLRATAPSISETDAMVLVNYLSDAALNAAFGNKFFSLSSFIAISEIDFEGMRHSEQAEFIADFEAILGQPSHADDLDFLAEVKQAIRVLMS